MQEQIKRKVRRRRRKLFDRFSFYMMQSSAKRADFWWKIKRFFKDFKKNSSYFAFRYSNQLDEAGEKNKRAIHSFNEYIEALGPQRAMRRSVRKERAKKRWQSFLRAFKPVRMYTFFRFLSILLISTIFSTIVTFLSLNKIWLISEKRLLLGVTIAAFFAFITDIIFMRRDYRKFSHIRPYSIVNFISHGAFAIVNIVSCCFLAHSHFYAYVFGITKLLRFTPIHIHPVFAAVFMNLFLLFSIPCTTIQIKRRRKKRRSRGR